jgi:hypothetical protein
MLPVKGCSDDHAARELLGHVADDVLGAFAVASEPASEPVKPDS